MAFALNQRFPSVANAINDLVRAKQKRCGVARIAAIKSWKMQRGIETSSPKAWYQAFFILAQILHYYKSKGQTVC